MRTEYKRDMNHNYLILYGENEINTDSYQVRMLVGNVIPSLLKCRIQGMDGQFLVYFDITSKQALNILYEERKMGVEDLRLIFGGFVKAMEDAAEYLMNPGQFIMRPEYIYMDIEKGQIYFCMMPGYERDIKEQFQILTEYILPKIDHQDGEAVILGYGVYKRAMEDSFHLEHIKEELYKSQNTASAGKRETEKRKLEDEKTGADQEQQSFQTSERFWENDESANEFIREGEASDKTTKTGILKKILIIVLSAAGLCGIAAAMLLGYLPYMETGAVLGGVIAAVGCGMLAVRIVHAKKGSTTLLKKQTQVSQRWDQKRMDSKIPDDIPDRKISEQYPDMAENMDKNMNEKKWEDRMYEALRKEPEPARSTELHSDYGETIVLSAGAVSGPASLVSKEPGELATIYLNEELTVIGKLETACDAVISLPTVSRIHAKIRKREENYYLTDMNSRNGTAVNGRMLLPDEEYELKPEDEVDFAQARYIFLL